MNLMTFGKGIEIIESVLNKKMTSAQKETYYMILKDLPTENFIHGLADMFRNREYTNIPAPGEIYKYCAGTKDENLKDLAIKSKSIFEKTVSRVSMYDNIAFSDPIIMKIIDSLGGWIKTNKMDIEELEKFLTFDFERIYINYAKNKGLGEVPIMFIGINDAQNNTKNPIPHHIIGDQEKYQAFKIAYQQAKSEGKIKPLISEFKNVNNLLEGGNNVKN